MATDSLREVGRIIRHGNRQADLAIKRVTNKIPKRERTRDTVSSVFPFSMNVISDGAGDKVSLDIDFNKPPPSDCISDCIGTTCEDHELTKGAYSLTTTNPYEAGTLKVFSEGLPLDQAQWFEENPGAGQVYVQVQSDTEMIIICYTYIAC